MRPKRFLKAFVFETGGFEVIQVCLLNFEGGSVTKCHMGRDGLAKVSPDISPQNLVRLSYRLCNAKFFFQDTF